MIVSLNWLKQYTDINLSVDELTALIGERLVEIESVEYLGDKYRDVIVAKVVESKALEGSDHLSIVLIDDGRVVDGVERNDEGLVQVVCGAPNVKVDTFVAWLPPNSIVPETIGDKEPFVLSAKPLRGVMSNGMLASAKELDLYDDHTGILIIDKDTKPGDSFMDLYELDDYILDIENKSLTHRPDVFGVIGFAREVAGIQGKAFSTPEWFDNLTVTTEPEGDCLDQPEVVIDDSSLSERFQAVVLTDIDESRSSSVQMQTYLARSGIRPISASVDIANYLMLLTGQPSHTYDYDKLLQVSGGRRDVHVRSAKEGEKLTLLDGREVTLDQSDIVIAAGDVAVGLAGAMGGASTAVDGSTKRVLLEVATFNLYNLRSTQMRHGIFSEAVTRFTKGIPASIGAPVLSEATRLLSEVAGSKAVGAVADSYPGKVEDVRVLVSTEQVNNILGTRFSADDVASLLENVGFGVDYEDGVANVSVPHWRKDISIPEDIVEEVGRLAGFDTIEFTLPKRSSVAVTPGGFDVLRADVRRALVRAGANEVLTYSFVHQDTISKAGQDIENSYQIVNSISPELQRYRQSLTPSLLSVIHPNVKAGYLSLALFELNKTHDKASGLTDESVPVEHDRLAFTIVVPEKTKAPFYSAKRYLDHLAKCLGVEFEYRNLEGSIDDPVASPFEPKRSALVYDTSTGEYIGVVGEYRKAARDPWKVSEKTAGFEIDLQSLHKVVEEVSVSDSYQPLSRYPGTDRDICFQVFEDIPYADVVDQVEAVLSDKEYIWSVEPVDIYKPEDGGVKNITIRINLGSYDKTLTGDEVASVCDEVIGAVIEKTKGKVV